MPMTIAAADTKASTRPTPINPAWVVEGDPQARSAILSTSPDAAAFAILWECTAGRFDWHYDIDEWVHVIEGSVVVSAPGQAPMILVPGSVALFPKGLVAHWHVETYVRKVAFCYMPPPQPAALALRAWRKLERIARSFSSRRPAPSFGPA